MLSAFSGADFRILPKIWAERHRVCTFLWRIGAGPPPLARGTSGSDEAGAGLWTRPCQGRWKAGRTRPSREGLPELGIGLDGDFGDIQARILVFGRGAQAHGRLEDEPDRKAHHEGEDT